jgi:dUTP pyrophosphatase
MSPEGSLNPTLVFPASESEIHVYPSDYVRLEFKRVHRDARVPYRKRETDAGYDLFSIEEVTIKPHSTENIRTGVIVVCPKGWQLLIEGRSSVWINGVAPFHAVIDSTYTGEMMVRLMNVSDTPYHIEKHDRIAQFVLHKAYSAVFVEVDEFSPDYNQRGEAGFGSSGR